MAERSTMAIAASWSVLLAGELLLAVVVDDWFALDVALTEAAGIGILAAVQAVVLKRDWLRAPVWAGIIQLVVTAAVVDLSRPLLSALALAGGLALLSPLASLAGRFARYGLLTGVLASVLGLVGSRLLILQQWTRMTPDGVGAWALFRAELSSTPRAVPGTSDGPPVVVITLDTLRYAEMMEMSSVQRVAALGGQWRALSTSSWTLPAMASVQTGLGPAGHGAAALQGGGFQGISDAVPTLPERLSAVGYHSRAVATNAWLSEPMGFSRGFHRFRNGATEPAQRLLIRGYIEHDRLRGSRATARALEDLAVLPDRGSHLWVHYVEPHLPYRDVPVPGWIVGLGEIPERLTTSAERESVRAAYRAEVSVLDAHLNTLLDGLEARGWLSSGIVVITSDHGEEFWEHGRTGHGHAHHGEVMDVGLVAAGPGIAAGSRSEAVASLSDIAPTILAMLGEPHDGMRGHDLRALPPDRVASGWGSFRHRVTWSARGPRYRAIADDRCEVRAYDLFADPAEQSPIALPSGHPVLLAVERAEAPVIEGAVDDVHGALAALGYIVTETDGAEAFVSCPSLAAVTSTNKVD